MAPVPRRLTINVAVHIVGERRDRHFSSRLSFFVVSLRGRAHPLLFLAGNFLADIFSVRRCVFELGVRGIYFMSHPKQSNTLIDPRQESLAPSLPVRFDG